MLDIVLIYDYQQPERRKPMKEYVVTYLNEDLNEVGLALFNEPSESEARCSFRVCYRHFRYKILSCVETGRS